jgi:hypothetical protein
VKYTEQGAELSPCGTYRYRLWREWPAPPCARRAAFVMLNPSTASGDADDPTVRKCVGFADRWRCYRVDIVNLFAFRATSPDVLVAEVRARGVDVAAGPRNDAAIRDVVRACLDARGNVVVAWGANARRSELRPRADAVRSLLRSIVAAYPEASIERLGSGAGSPPHPLMLAYATPRESAT